jgi:hypothetical protein
LSIPDITPCIDGDEIGNMSMICWIMGFTPAQISALRASPSLVPSLVVVAEDDQRKARFDEAIKRGSPEQRKQLEANQAAFEAKLREAQAPIAEARNQLATIGALEPALSLEKSWHMLHYLFTGHAGPATAPGDLLLTGEDLGEDLGYGPARLHTEIATRDFSHFLDMQELERLQARIDFGEMRRLRVYSIPMGPGSDAEYTNELRGEVGFYFTLLREYVRGMSDKGNGLLVWLS